MKKIILILILIPAGILHAGLFDARYPSARATALSNSVVAVSADVWSSYYNPAGISSVTDYQFGASYQIPFNLSFFKNYFFSAVMPLPAGFGGAGISLQDFGVKYQGNDLSSEYTFALTHGFSLMSDIHTSLSLGYNLKYYYWDLGESVDGLDLGSGGALGLDIGLQASLYGRTYLGVYVLNINTPKIGERVSHDLPRRISIGLAYRPQNDITTSIAMDKSFGFETQLLGGFEYHVIEMIAIRLGVSTQPSRFSAGLGFNYQGLHFNYALQTHPVLSETHQFGLSYIFGN